MSLLLDALNKADQERKRGDGPPSIDSRHDTYRALDRSKTPPIVIVLVVGLLLALLLLAVYWLGKSTQQSTVSVVAAQQSNDAQKPANTGDSNPTSPKIQYNATNNGQQGEGMDRGETIVSQDPINPSAASNLINTSNNEDLSEADGVANLYQQQTNNSTSTNALLTDRQLTTPSTTGVIAETLEHQTAPNSINQFANLPELRDLPNAILAKIPTLKYTEHNYNKNGGNVVINGEVKHVNDSLGNGVVIDKILSDGLILHIDNFSFKMRAMNTWINM